MVLKLSRPRFWLYTTGPFLVGSLAAYKWAIVDPFFWTGFFLFLLIANIFLYGINDIFDQDTDAHNVKKTQKEVKATKAHDFFVIVSAVILGLASFMLKGEILVAYVIFLLLSFFYSAPPFRFKKYPLVDSMSNVLYIMPGLIGYLYYGGTISWPVIFAAWCWVAAMHLYSAIPDIVPDKKAGLFTTAVVFGKKRSLILCFILWSLATILSGFWFGLVYPFMIVLSFYKPVDKLYWYFPIINAIIGTILTLVILW